MTVNPVTVGPDATLDQALEQLEEYGFRHLPVVEKGSVVGIVSDRDLRLATSWLGSNSRLEGVDGEEVPGVKRVREIMTSPVHTLPRTAFPGGAAQDMLDRQIGAIPVVEDGELVGIVTETDLLRAFLELCRLNDGACDDLVRYHMHRPLPCVPPEMGMHDALEEMDPREAHLGVKAEGKLVGFLSQRDLFMGLAREMIDDAKAQSTGDLDMFRRRVEDFMTLGIQSACPGDGLSDCARTMVTRRVSALPVFEDGVPIGLLTQRDILGYYAALVNRGNGG